MFCRDGWCCVRLPSHHPHTHRCRKDHLRELLAICTLAHLCQKFAQANSITPDQLYAWNNILGSAGSNCSIQFFANYYYCVSASGVTSLLLAPTTTSIAAPNRLKWGFRATATSMAKPNSVPLALPLRPQTKSLETISTPGTRSLGLAETIATTISSQDTAIARAFQCRRRSRPETLATVIVTPRRGIGIFVSSLRRIKVSRRINCILGTPCWVLRERTVGPSFSRGIGAASGLIAEGISRG